MNLMYYYSLLQFILLNDGADQTCRLIFGKLCYLPSPLRDWLVWRPCFNDEGPHPIGAPP